MARATCWPLLAFALIARPVAADESQPTDPNVDEVASIPTAWTYPTGGWSVSSIMIVGVRTAASLHPRLHVELHGLVPNNRTNTAGAGAAVLVHHGSGVQVVARADADVGVDHDAADGLRPYVRSFAVRSQALTSGLSLVGSVCTDAACRGSATLALREGWSRIDGLDYYETAVATAVFVPAGRPLLFGHGELEVCDHANDCYDLVSQLGAGVRFAGTQWACDLGFSKRFGDKQEGIRVDDLTVVGSPWLSVTYRHP